MEEDEIMACMSLKKWEEIVEIVEKLAEVNGVD